MNQNNPAGSNQRGAVVILVAVSLIMIVGFAALAVDVTRHVMVGNEVQNAVDAGALAGARALYIINPIDNSTIFTPQAATDEAEEVTQANSANAVNIALENMTVQRGHWTFNTESNEPGTFDNNSTTIAYEFDDTDTDESLNIEPAWVNAVRVEASTAGPVLNLFARIFGIDGFNTTRDAVAYIGFAGYVPPEGVDLPIAICEGAMEEGRCTIGRMFPDNDQTGRWTDFTQNSDDPPSSCDTANMSNNPNSQSVPNLLEECAGNPSGVNGGTGVSTTNGSVGNALQALEDCFLGGYDNNTARIMHVTLPIIDCEGSIGTTNCKLVRGFINIDIVWVKFARDETFSNVPEQIFDVNEDGVPDTADDEELYQVWPHDGFVWPETATGEERWASFIDEDEGFNLQDNDGLPPDYNRQMTVYFRPNCEITVPTGPPGGSYFGIISQIPVLVE